MTCPVEYGSASLAMAATARATSSGVPHRRIGNTPCAIIVGDSPLSHEQFLALHLPLTVALASVTTLIAYAFIRRIRGTADRAGNVLQARRVGYLAALALVTLALLSALELLTPFNGTLVVA